MGPGFAFNVGRGVGAVIMPFTVGALAKTYGLGFGIGLCSLIFFSGVLTVFLMPETLNGEKSETAPAVVSAAAESAR